MDISIITPVYKGNKYLKNYMNKISQACQYKENVEVILVNDSPEIPIEYDENLVDNFQVNVFNNKHNIGIHKSRVEGLKKAKGKYILFLDQDDEIMENTLKIQYNLITQKKAELVLGNGLFEEKDKQYLIYKNKFSQRFASKKINNILIRDFIVSPGQCLIKKEAIPQYWVENFLEDNGADDYFLWILMFNNNVKIVINYEKVYIHKYTGKNLSLNKEKMYKSQLNMLEKLKRNKEFNNKELKLLERTIYYKYNYKRKFLKETLKNIDIFVYNVLYKLIWKGYTVNENR